MMRLRTCLTVTALAASLLVSAAGAAEFSEKRFNVTPFAGWTFFDRELKASTGIGLDNDYYWGGRLGMRIVSPLWLDLAGGYVKTAACDCEPTWTHLSANLLLVSSAPHMISPFVSLGGGVSKFVPQWNTSKMDGTFEAAAGFKVKLTQSLGLRLEARNILLVPKKDYSKSHIDNIVAGAGLTFAFGGRDEDSDGDGVRDKRDKCPDTQHGCVVDANGCPIDSDGDGVCDGLDQCPSTPRGAKVDARGCPTDSDGDGVWDGLDKCPDTPKGCTVDASGCPIDSDGDGVCDGLDKCPNTAQGCKVDAAGCPIDSDGDGVCDGLDKCADTPAGVKVDQDGCPVFIPREKQMEMELLNTGMIRLSNVNFDYDKATIRPEAHAVLDTVGRVLTKWPGLKIEIGGHTDSRGSDAYNKSLSQRRAASVRTYLLAHFSQFKADQITSKGYGESVPIAPNDTQANMQLNRRVEFVVLNKEVLKQPR